MLADAVLVLPSPELLERVDIAELGVFQMFFAVGFLEIFVEIRYLIDRSSEIILHFFLVDLS